MHISPGENYFAVDLGKQVVIYDLEKIVADIRAETERNDTSDALSFHLMSDGNTTRLCSTTFGDMRECDQMVIRRVSYDHYTASLLFSDDESSLFFSDFDIIRKIVVKDGRQSTFSTPLSGKELSPIILYITLHDQAKRLSALTNEGTLFIWDVASERLLKVIDTDRPFGIGGDVYMDPYETHFVFYDQEIHFVGEWDRVWNDSPPETPRLVQNGVSRSRKNGTHYLAQAPKYGTHYLLAQAPMAVNGALPYMVRVCYGDDNRNSLKLTLNYILNGSIESEVPLDNLRQEDFGFDAGDMKKIAINRDGTLVLFLNDSTKKCRLFEVKDAQIPLLALILMVYFDQQKSLALLLMAYFDQPTAPFEFSIDSLEHKLLMQLEEPVRNSLIRFFNITFV